MGKRILRILQRQDEVRASERRVVLFAIGSKDRDRALENPLQHEKTAQFLGWKAASSANFSTYAQVACTGFINTVSGSKTPGWSVVGGRYTKLCKEMLMDRHF